MRRAAIFLVAATTVACGLRSLPGRGVTPELSEPLGCDYDAVMEHAEELGGPGGALGGTAFSEEYKYVPRVGQTACELLATNGKPARVDTQQSMGASGVRNSMSWWYETGKAMYPEQHLVSLTFHPECPKEDDLAEKTSCWVVDYVGW